jgi:hypothetical protein
MNILLEISAADLFNAMTPDERRALMEEWDARTLAEQLLADANEAA